MIVECTAMNKYDTENNSVKTVVDYSKIKIAKNNKNL